MFKNLMIAAFSFLTFSVPSYSQEFSLDSIKAVDLPAAAAPAPAVSGPAQPKDWTIIFYATTKDALRYSFVQSVLELKSVGATSKVNIAIEGTFPVENAAGVVSTPTVRLALGSAWDEATINQVVDNAVTKDKMISESVLTALSGDVVSREFNTDSGDWKRVAAFARWAKTAYPAKHYAFVIFGHGSGIFDAKKTAQKGTLMDVETKDYVTLPEMRTMMASIGHVDAFVMTSCIMQMGEVAWQIKDYTDVIVGSSELMWSSGYDMAGLVSELTANPSVSSEQLGADMAKGYVDRVKANKLPGGHASVILTSRLPDFGAKLDAWVDAEMALNDKEAINKGIAGASRFDIFGFTLSTTAAAASRVSISGDLYDFVSIVTENTPQATPAQQLARQRGQELMSFISDSLIYKYYYTGQSNTGFDFARSHGVSLHVPPVKMIGGSWAEFSKYLETDYWSLPFAKETKWGTFLNWIYGRSPVRR